MAEPLRWLAYDLLTRQLRAEVPFTEAKFSDAISSPGSLDASLPAARPEAAAAVLDIGRTGLYCTQGDRLLWGGIPWARQRQGGDTPTVRIAGQGPWSLYREGRRTIRVDKTYTAQEQYAIVADLLAYTHGLAGGDPLGLTLRRHPTNSGVTRDQVYDATERKPIGEAIEELGAAAGFEFLLTCEWDTSVTPRRPAHYLDLWAPRLGRLTSIVWQHGHDIDLTEDAQDGSKLAAHIDAIGSGSGASKIIRTASTTTSGYPLLEGQVSYTDESSTDVLDDHAAAELDRRSTAVVTAKARILALDRWPLGSWLPGDQVWISGHDAGLDFEGYMRIQGYTATSNENGQLAVEVDLAEGAALGRPILGPARRLLADDRDLLRRLERLERA